MECNCNNNNNGGVIPWVRGNRLPLCICIYQMNVEPKTAGTMTYNSMTRTPYEIQADDTVTVVMKSGFRQVEMPFTTDGNKVFVIDNGELPTGTYTVEVTIERGSGERGRWQETRQVRIYENTEDAVLGGMYSIEADLFFWAKGDTGVGIADITPNPDDTLTITMTDGTTYTTNAVRGAQGEQGEPGEKGTSIVSFDVTGQTDVSVIYTVTFSDDTTQDVAVPKGPQGDTGLTGNGISSTTLNSDYTLTITYTDGTTYTTSSIRGAQGVQGVSVIGFTQTGETATNTLYNLVFSDGRTQSVAIPKGLKGDKGDTGNTGSQGAQGPKGDTVTATDYTLYNVQGSDSQGAMSQDATTKSISAQTGYYTCSTSAATAAKVVTVESGNLYKRTLGGHFKVKMTNANTAASGVTLQIGSETATALYYNGAAVSASNTWEENEVISVYYDGSVYQASNAQGGNKKEIEKIVENTTVYENIAQPPSNGFLNASGVWLVNSYTNTHCKIERGTYTSFKVTANSSQDFQYAFLTAYSTPVNGESPTFCEGYSGRFAVAAGQSATISIPSDCNYIIFNLLNTESNDHTPDNIQFGNPVKEVASQNASEIAEIEEGLTIWEDFPIHAEKTYGITNDGHWNMSTSAFHYQVSGIIGGKDYKIQASSSQYTRIWWCTAAAIPVRNGSIPLCDGETGMHITPAGASGVFTAPEDATYMYVDGGVSSPAGVYTPFGFADSHDDIRSLESSVDDLENIKSDAIAIPYDSAKAISTTDGTLVTRDGCGHSNYIPTRGSDKVLVYAPALGTSVVGIAFYTRQAVSSFCGKYGFSHVGGDMQWRLYNVPEGAHYFRMTLFTNTPSQYKLVTSKDYLKDLQIHSLQSMIGTQIMRNAVPISDKKYLYAFGAAQYAIVKDKAYVSYGANENTVDGDRPDAVNVGCLAIVDLFDLSHEVAYHHNGTLQYSDGTIAQNATIGMSTYCAGASDIIAKFGLMRFGNNNPYYSYSFFDVNNIPVNPETGQKEPVYNWTTCRLNYTGLAESVDFTVNNYRQMLVDMGYMDTYVASNKDYLDNINIHYNKEENIYYAVLCGAAAAPTSSNSLPLVLMQSSDMATWSPLAYLGLNVDAGEIQAIYKGGVVYVVYRRIGAGMEYIVYDVANSTELSSGAFPVSPEMLSKPDVFTFDNNVYMALNVDPSIYGEMLNYDTYFTDARQEIAIYKVVNGEPKLFRTVNNPTGIDYFSFVETPPMYASQSSTNPMYAQGAIYCAFSEDRRHLYRRQIAQMSFTDVTALFADFGRIV